MSQSDVDEQRQEDFERSVHAQQLTQVGQEQDEGEQAEILRYLSEIDDLPIEKDDPVMGQLVSKLASTSNLSVEQVRSNEWMRECLLVLYLCKHPSKDGMHGTDRAWAHDDWTAHMEPMAAQKRMEIEAFLTNSKLALTRSEDFKAVEEATRTVNESIVNDQGAAGSGGGGILGRLGLR